MARSAQLARGAVAAAADMSSAVKEQVSPRNRAALRYSFVSRPSAPAEAFAGFSVF